MPKNPKVLPALILPVALAGFALSVSAQESTSAVAEVAAQADAAVEDAILGLKVKTALLDKLGWEATRINVDVKTGTVWLTGKVKSRGTIGAAGEIAKAAEGVKELKNGLEVEGASDKGKVAQAVEHAQREVDDAVLESRVKGNLLQQMGRVAFSVEVEANGGIVSLTGHVPDELRHKLALQTAERVSGVKKLVDLIEIKP
jgi:osmotically-inducible protein OsmY